MTTSVRNRPGGTVRHDWWRAPALLLAVWVFITFGGGRLVSGGHRSLDALSRQQLVWPPFLAALVVLGGVVLFGWRRHIGLGPPRRGLPYVVPLVTVGSLTFLVMTITALGFGGANVLLLVNVMAASVSEELMFRGVVFWAVARRYGAWTAVPASAGAFGAVHLLDVIITGNLGGSVVQAVLATMAGIWYGALRARGGSLVPLLLIHTLFAFSVGAGAGAGIEYLAALVDLGLLGYGVLLWTRTERPRPARPPR